MGGMTPAPQDPTPTTWMSLQERLAGYLAAVDLRLPFWAFGLVMTACLLIALAVGSRAIIALAPTRDDGRRIRMEASG